MGPPQTSQRREVHDAMELDDFRRRILYFIKQSFCSLFFFTNLILFLFFEGHKVVQIDHIVHYSITFFGGLIGSDLPIIINQIFVMMISMFWNPLDCIQVVTASS